MKKQFLAAALAACLLLAGTGAAAADDTPAHPFTDVPADAWYAGTVEAAYRDGLMKGDSATSFRPEGTVTVAEAWMITARLHSLSHGGDGNIPAGKVWYTGAQQYLQQQGILDKALQTLREAQGYIDSYRPDPDKAASRLYLADLLSQALPPEQLPAINHITAIPDLPAAASAEGAARLLTLYNAGVLTGKDEWGTLGVADADNVTRAETAAMAVRLAEPAQRKAFTVREMPFTVTRIDNAAPGLDITMFLLEVQEGLIQCGRTTPDSNWRYGYINTEGKPVIPLEYDWVSNVKEGYVGVSKNGRRAVLDTQGNTAYTPPKDPAAPGHTYGATYGGHGMFLLSSEDGKWGVADPTGKTVLPVQYGGVSVLSDNLIAANRDWGPYALFDAAGNQISEAAYSLTQHEFHDGRMLIQRDGKYGFLDENGNEAIPAQFHYASYNGFSDGIALVTPAEDGRFAYIDTAGNIVIDAAQYVSADPFSGGLAAVWYQEGGDNHCRVLQKDGTPWMPEVTARYDSIGAFIDGAALVSKDGLGGVVGADGTERIAPQYEDFTRFGPLFAGRRVVGAPYTFYNAAGEALSPQPDWRYPTDRLSFAAGYAVYEGTGYNSAVFSPDGTQLTPYIFNSGVNFNGDGIAVVSLYGPIGTYALRAK